MNVIIRCNYLFYLSNLWFSSKSSTKIFNHVLAINHIWRYNLLKYLYILATSLRTHYGNMSFKKNCFLIYKYFFDVDGPFLCLDNGGNSPPKKMITTLIFFFILSKILDKVYIDFKY